MQMLTTLDDVSVRKPRHKLLAWSNTHVCMLTYFSTTQLTHTFSRENFTYINYINMCVLVKFFLTEGDLQK